MSFLCLHQLDFAGNTSILIDLFKLIKCTDWTERSDSDLG